MLKFLLNRLWQAAVVLVGVTLIVFIMVNVAPGDPVAVMMERKADAATIERIRTQMGLNDPLPAQYFRFLKNALTGDFGNSYFQKLPVSVLLARGFGVTGALALGVLAFAVMAGIAMGTLAAAFRGHAVDRFIMFVSTLGMALPSFWLAILLQLV